MDDIMGLSSCQLTKTIEVIGSNPDNHCWLPFVGIQVWRRDFILDVIALSVIQGFQTIDP